MSWIFGKLGGLLGGAALKLGLMAAIAGAVLMVLLGARSAGRNAERAEQLKRTMEAVRDAKDAERGLADPAERKRVRERFRRR